MDEWLLFSSVLHFHIPTPRIFSDFPAFPAATAFLLMQLVMMLCLGRARQLWRVKNPKPEMKSGMCECSAVVAIKGGRSPP